MIHVCFGIHDGTGHYSKFTGTTILSLFENTTSEVTVHILHDDTLTDENRDKFSLLATRYNQLIKFYNVDELCADKITEYLSLIPDLETSWVSVGAFYRFLIPQLLPKDIKEVIYLDSDIIVNLDINELWQIELGDKILAVVPEFLNSMTYDRKRIERQFLLVSDGLVKAEDYFNSGVMIMNLDLLRDEEECIMQGIKFRGENPQQIYWDQTVWNYCFSARALHLPIDFNQFVLSIRKAPEPTVEKKIYHYCASPKELGLRLDCDDPFNRLWMKYFAKTPWFDEDTIGKLHEEMKKIRQDVLCSALKLSATMSGKTRAFFIEPAKIESMKEFFFISDDDTIILANNNDAVERLLGAMNFSRGACLFFIMTQKFQGKGFPFHLLTKEGFVEEVDFVKGWKIFPEAYGDTFRSYPIIKAM